VYGEVVVSGPSSSIRRTKFTVINTNIALSHVSPSKQYSPNFAYPLPSHPITFLPNTQYPSAAPNLTSHLQVPHPGPLHLPSFPSLPHRISPASLSCTCPTARSCISHLRALSPKWKMCKTVERSLAVPLRARSVPNFFFRGYQTIENAGRGGTVRLGGLMV
jgi:hypothetical protein